MQNQLLILILAAGKGTRMNSNIPKVLHQIAGQSLLQRVINIANQITDESNIFVLVGHKKEQIIVSFKESNVQFIEQKEPKGTAHAVQVGIAKISQQRKINDNQQLLILYGDCPLIKVNSLKILIDLMQKEQSSLSLLSAMAPSPFGYGRVVRNSLENIEKIVEEKSADDNQKKINEINTGVMCLGINQILPLLHKIQVNSTTNELYLTDLIEILIENNHKISTYIEPIFDSVQGINDKNQLQECERYFQQKQACLLMKKGLTLYDAQRFDLRGNLEFGMNCKIDINCVFIGNVKLGNNVIIESNCIVTNSNIADAVHIKAMSIIEQSNIGSHSQIGPFARLREGTEIAKEVKIGNFVETKKTQLDKGAKVSHLSYIGDAKIGKNVNIGAGAITCNYDGMNKYKTQIAQNTFIGSNSSLVAPIQIGENALVSAGSVVTNDIKDNEIAFGRARQINKQKNS